MGLFKKKKTVLEQMQKSKTNIFGDDLTKLNPDGSLPFGWVAHNVDFTRKIQDDFSHFIELYKSSMKKSPIEQYSALKSYVLFLNDAKSLCKRKGECHSKWFSDCVADDVFIRNKEKELQELTAKLKK